jgi:hypothetical protein
MIECHGELQPFLTDYFIEKIEREAHNKDGNVHTAKYTDELRKIVGLLNHIAIKKRPDILFPVSHLATKIVDARSTDIIFS